MLLIVHICYRARKDKCHRRFFPTQKQKQSPGLTFSSEQLAKWAIASSRSDLSCYQKSKANYLSFARFQMLYFFQRNCVQASKCLENYTMLRSCQWLTCLRCGQGFPGKKNLFCTNLQAFVPLSIINTQLLLGTSWEFPSSCYTGNDRSSRAESF